MLSLGEVGVKRTFKQSELKILSHTESNNSKNKAVFVAAKTEKKIKHAFSIRFEIELSKERFIHLHYQRW